MPEGLSTARQCHAFADCLVREGRSFVVRYHSRTTQQPQKRLSPQEAALLARAGLDLATVYQDRARLPEDFGAERGRVDGRSAQVLAAQVGQPPGSAIYFAVDVDFDASQIRRLVLPYFQGVKDGMDDAAGGASAFAIGVYGSGLACRTLRDDARLARFAWLAESTGWAGSRDFDGWDVKQHLNRGESLCGLGTAWERCEARPSFGQFRPIGFELHRDEGTPMRVVASELNLRRLPATAGNTPIARLPEGTVVRVLGPADPPWMRVRVTLGGGEAIGYVSGKFLAATAPATDRAAVAVAAAAGSAGDAAADARGAGAPRVTVAMPLAAAAGAAAAAAAAPSGAVPSEIAVPAVHFREDDPQSRRGSTARRAQPLGETPRPARNAQAGAATRVAQLGEIVRWLDVERSARWQPVGGTTFCNVYAADFCYLARVYLPRTWWTEGALLRIGAGDVPSVQYEQTVRELRADDLQAWLVDFGPRFGWRRVFDASALQDAANRGGVGLICADRAAPGRPGHISVVVPETGGAKARRDADGHVVLPLQSQAGATNFAYGTGGSAWWEDDVKFRAFILSVHD